MSNLSPDAPQHHRPHSSALAGTFLEFNLTGEIDQLQREPGWTTGPNAKTIVKYDDLQIVIIALRAGGRIPDHRTEGHVAIQIVRGHVHVHVRAEGRTFDLRAGGLLTLERGLVHDVDAIEDSALLLTIAGGRRGA